MMSRQLLTATLLALSVGCGRSPRPEPGAPETRGQLPEAPVSGILVFEQGADVWWQRLGHEAPQLLSARSRYPRLAPDGQRMVCVSESRVLLVSLTNATTRVVYKGKAPRCADFSKDGAALLISDQDAIWRVREGETHAEKLFDAIDALEIDAGPSGQLVATVRRGRGYAIMALDIGTRTRRLLAPGCSAALSPDGQRVLSNPDGHRETLIRSWADGSVLQRIPNPTDARMDNHAWSDQADWITCIREQDGAIFALELSSERWHQLTEPGANDRPDLVLTP